MLTGTGRRRPLDLPERFNLRDVGGRPTADGRRVVSGCLYRGAGLHHATAAELGRLETLRLRTIVDLRTPGELRHGAVPDGGAGARLLSLPLIQRTPRLEDVEPGDPVELLSGLYLWMLDVGAATIARVFSLLAEQENLPVLVFCAAGKDRTGIVTALVLACLGVEDRAIANEYSLSHRPVQELRRWIETHVPVAGEAMARQPDGLIDAPARAMEVTLEAVSDAHGSVARYLQSIGVAPATIASVRRNLLVP